MSNNGDEFLSDEDMFSPKKTNRSKNVPIQPVEIVPGCKDQYIAKYKKLLNGIPPPPGHTNPDYHLDKLLSLWKDNQALLWDGNKNGNSTKEKDEGHPLGVCHNIDRSCEEFELMGSQLCERNIWSETVATTSTAYMKLTQSAKKRRKANGWGMSPRTRMSYLTRRTTTFHKDNIASAVAATKPTQILVARSEPGKKVAGKGNGMKGKRALFLSPEHVNKFQTPEQGKSKRLIRRLTLNSSPARADLERSQRDSEKSSEKKRCSRSLFSTTPEPANSNHPSQKQQPPPQQQQQQQTGLTTQHRQKMLWAVSNALKAVKIRMSDPEFKTCANRLFKATTDKWQNTASAASGDRKTSTSDAMLAAAKSLVEEITGRKMSPKSAKKTAPKSQKIRTPEKFDARDENNPPVSSTAESILSEMSLDENGVFPLERVGILAEKLVPGGNVSNVGSFVSPRKSSGRKLFVEESLEVDFDPDTLTSRKRKRQDTERRSPKATEVMVSQRLRNRTPHKAVCDLSSGPSDPCRSADFSGIARMPDDPEDRLTTASPTVKRQKLESTTPVKSMAIGMPVRQSPRLLSNRTTLKSLTGDITPSKSLITIFETPSKSMTRSGTPLKPLTTIEETPPKSVTGGRTPCKSTNAEGGTPLKSLSSYDTPSKIGARVTVSPKKLSESKSPAVRRILTPTIKTPRPLKQTSLCQVTESANTPDTTFDGAKLDHLTPKKCVTFEDDKPLLLLPGDSEDENEPPVLRPEVPQRRSVRCFSEDLPPPKLFREIELSPSPVATDGRGQNRHSAHSHADTLQTPVTRRRASAPAPGQKSPAVPLESTGGRSGRKKVSLSLAGVRKSLTPEDPADVGKLPDDADVTSTPRRKIVSLSLAGARKSKTPEEPR